MMNKAEAAYERRQYSGDTEDFHKSSPEKWA